jgi:hypothetical protein
VPLRAAKIISGNRNPDRGTKKLLYLQNLKMLLSKKPLFITQNLNTLAGFEPESFVLQADAMTTSPLR